MDNIDRQLLTVVQANFPISIEPFKQLAEGLGIDESEVIHRLEKLKEDGVVRRIGAIFDSKKLGYHSTLCAIKVPADRLEEVAEIINSYPGVTHNYIREHDYNMWFTLIAPSKEAVTEIHEDMCRKTGISDLIDLPAIKFFKIRVNFDLSGEG